MIYFLAAALMAEQPAQPALPYPKADIINCPVTDDVDSQLCRAVEANKQGRFAEGAALFEQAAVKLAESNPIRRDQALAAAGNLWIAAGQPGKAALALDKALAGTGLQAEQHGLALLDRARAADAQGDFKIARGKVTEAAKTISASGNAGKVFSTGFALPDAIKSYLKDGSQKCFALWNPYELGYLATYATHLKLAGKLDLTPGTTFEAGKAGSYTVGEGGEIVYGKPLMFTKDNVDDAGF